MIRRTLLSLLFLAAAAAPAAAAPVDAASRAAVVAKAAGLLRERYVFPEIGARAAAKIEGELAAGRYDAIGEGPALAARLSEDLRSVAHDAHLNVFARGGPQPGEELGGPPPASKAGFVRVDRLAGNVGYIRLIGFPPAEQIKPMADQAMAMVAGARALILDLRQNFGGDETGVAYMVGFFVDGAQPAHVNDLIWRDPGATTTRTESTYTSPTPVKYLGKPVYVLTARTTFSAGEELAYDLQAMKRAVIVGEPSGGGANPGDLMPLGEDFNMFVPTGRARNPITGANWEGKGVTPDVAVAPGEALKTALQRLGVAAKGPDVDAVSAARLFQASAAKTGG